MSSAGASWLIAVMLALVAAPAADAANLRLDHRFGEGGIARVRFEAAQGGGPDLKALRPVRQPDGKVLVTAAWHGDHGEAHFLIARFTRSGRPDASFGHGGRERLGVRWNFDPYAVHVQPDGRILVLGAAGYGAGWNFQGQIGLIRLLPDGTRDRAFGTNGLVAWNPPWRAGTVNLVALPGVFVPQADGTVLAVGFVQERINLGLPGPYPEARRVVSVRFNQRGSVDESFGRGGMIEGPDGADIPVYWAAFPDGHLAGLDVGPEGGGVMTGSLQRFNPDGTLDQGFGQDGSVQLGSNLPAGATELLPARDGSLVIVGSDPAGRATVRRIAPEGQLDPGFRKACNRPEPRAGISGGAVSSHGGVLATASRELDTPPYRSDSFVLRYDPNGCLAGRPLRIKGVSAGPPRLQGRRTALIGASSKKALALIQIRR